jgi:hypothetical protein
MAETTKTPEVRPVFKKPACPECGRRDPAAREQGGLHCLPLAQRRGPSVTDPKHPSNDGSFAEYMAAVGRLQARGVLVAR